MGTSKWGADRFSGSKKALQSKAFFAFPAKGRAQAEQAYWALIRFQASL